MPGCRRPIGAGGALTLSNRARDRNDALAWRWDRGPAVATSDFGDPLTVTAYRFCVYDAAGKLVIGAGVPPGGVCNAKTGSPCWHGRRLGFAYRNFDVARSAIRSIDLHGGAAAGAARITLRGRGALLALPRLRDLALPLRAQLAVDGGGCWEAENTPTINESRTAPSS